MNANKNPEPLSFRQYLYAQKKLLLLLLLVSAISVLPSFLLFGHRSWGLALGTVAAIAIVAAIYLLSDYWQITRSLQSIARDMSAGLREYKVPPGRKVEGRWRDLLEKQAQADRQELLETRHSLHNWEEDIAALVHDVKTPLAAAGLILEDSEHVDISALRSSLYFLERRVTQILYYAKSKDLARDYRIRTVELNDLVKRSVANMAPYLVTHDVRIETQSLYHPVKGDPKWLEFILQNLIENSVKHAGRPAPTLTFMAAPVPGKDATDLFVIDDGPGIPAEERMHVFKRGFTGHMNGRKTSSTGLGLYLVKTMCERLSIEVDIIPPELMGVEQGAVIRLRFYDEAFLSV